MRAEEGLKPCPFCGGGALVSESGGGFSVVCENWCGCCCSVGCDIDLVDGGFAAIGVFPTAEAAREHWNRRAERTCRHDEEGNCTECGKHLGRENAYCKHCGAKVVGE